MGLRTANLLGSRPIRNVGRLLNEFENVFIVKCDVELPQ